LEGEQEGGRKVEEEGSWRRKTRTETDSATTIGVAEEATTGPAPMEGVERTNAVVVRGQGQGAGVPPRRDPFAMDIDRGRNCYACGRFGHMAHYCRNRGQRGRVAEGRRLEYGEGRIEGINEHLDNLKGVEDLESLD